jgi:8-oxo-dGTP pyrophosphatase MutT (NUDIX family)
MRELIERRLALRRPLPDPRARLLADAEGPITPELRKLLEQPVREAAVLLTLIDRPRGWTVLFTRRARHLAHHPGQISFPGGRIDRGDEGAVAAALREAWEEVRLPPADVRVAGMLPPHVTGTGFTVTPVVGFAPGAYQPLPDPAEVETVFEVPLDVVLAPGSLRLTYRERLGTRFRVYELEYGGHVIWGATASMLKTFKEVIEDETAG